MRSVIKTDGIFTPVSSGVFTAGSPLWLFANGRNGAWFDVSDGQSVFQDSAANTPATTAGQPVGFLNDKVLGVSYGSSLISGGDFEGGLIGTKLDSSGSVSTWALNTTNPISGAQDGLLDITTSSGSGIFPRLTLSSAVVFTGQLVEFSFDYKVNSGAPILAAVWNGVGYIFINQTLSGESKFSYNVRYGASSGSVLLPFGNAIGAVQFDNIALKLASGAFAFQAASASRPTLGQERGLFYLTGGALNWTAPAGDYTIAYVGDAGVVVLENQTLSGATDIMATTKVFEYVAVQGSLGSGDIRRLQEYLNRKAGRL